MNDTVIGYIRTYAPMVAGAIVGFLVSIGVIDTDASAQLVAALSIVIALIAQGLWYLLGRTLGKRWPWLEKWMLGSSQTPTYSGV